jgi:hypothetical protein
LVLMSSDAASAPAPAQDQPAVELPTAAAVNAAGDKAIAKHKGKPSELAANIFKARRLTGEEFDKKQQDAFEHNGEDGLITEQVVDPGDLRIIFLEDLGDAVGSKDLFALVQAADPDGDGWIQVGGRLAHARAARPADVCLCAWLAAARRLHHRR